MSLADLFPDGDYRFHLTLRRSEPRAFFTGRDPGGRILSERRQWLEADTATYAAVQPEGMPALREFADVAEQWIREPVPGTASALEILLWLGRVLEPDLLFLTADAAGRFRLRAGALCFPTGWALQEKLGHTLESIHGVVPGLNDALAAPIQQFLSRLKPGLAYLRDNWGVAATEELNLHPSRRIAAPDLPTSLDRLWLRVEHQALLALPNSGGIVFGIRIALHRLDEVAAAPEARQFRRALESMPRAMLEYKRLDRVREYLLNRV